VKAHDINEVARCGFCGANADRTYAAVAAKFDDMLKGQLMNLSAKYSELAEMQNRLNEIDLRLKKLRKLRDAYGDALPANINAELTKLDGGPQGARNVGHETY
jgi:hypothetical protein